MYSLCPDNPSHYVYTCIQSINVFLSLLYLPFFFVLLTFSPDFSFFPSLLYSSYERNRFRSSRAYYEQIFQNRYTTTGHCCKRLGFVFILISYVMVTFGSLDGRIREKILLVNIIWQNISFLFFRKEFILFETVYRVCYMMRCKWEFDKEFGAPFYIVVNSITWNDWITQTFVNWITNHWTRFKDEK